MVAKWLVGICDANGVCREVKEGEEKSFGEAMTNFLENITQMHIPEPAESGGWVKPTCKHCYKEIKLVPQDSALVKGVEVWKHI